MSEPIVWKKQFTESQIGGTNLSNSNSKSNPIGIQKRRKSSLQSLYSPYTRRRSFLSKAMLENETLQCYKIPTYSTLGSNDENIPTFSISLSESQGFIWNQDLFASRYQQNEAGVDSKFSMSNDFDDDNNNYSHHNIEVIDVILTNEDYNSDVEITTEIVKVGNEGDDGDDDDDDDDYEDDNEDDNEYNNEYLNEYVNEYLNEYVNEYVNNVDDEIDEDIQVADGNNLNPSTYHQTKININNSINIDEDEDIFISEL